MTHEEMRNAIRNELKELGYNNRKVGITIAYSGYSECIIATIKDLSISITKIEKVISKYRSVTYDERTQEVLEGGNTYVHVDYDCDILYSAIDEQLERASKIANSIKDKNEDVRTTLLENDNVIVYLSPDRCRENIGRISIQNKKENSSLPKTEYRFLESIYDLAKFLVFYDYQIK